MKRDCTYRIIAISALAIAAATGLFFGAAELALRVLNIDWDLRPDEEDPLATPLWEGTR